MNTSKENELNPTLTIDELMGYVHQTCSDEAIETIEWKLHASALNQAALEGALLMANEMDLDPQTMLNFKDELAFKAGLHNNIEEPTYTLEELLAMFEPVEHYDAMLEVVERSAPTLLPMPIHVLSPQNETNCYNTIIFELDRPAPQDLTLIIENNQEDELIENVFPAHAATYRQLLTGFAPGCYYWKLILDEDNMLMGKFYVRKDLMPH